MDTSPITKGSIIVGVDGSPASDLAVQWAVDQARRESRPITLVHAVSPHDVMWLSSAPSLDPTPLELIAEAGQVCLQEARALAGRVWPEAQIAVVYRHCDPRDALIELGTDAAMIVVGSRGRGTIASLLLGSVSVTVARQVPCPVVVVKPGHGSPDNRQVLVGIDGQGGSRVAIEFAFRQASARSVGLVVAHCFWNDEAKRKPVELSLDGPGLEAQRGLLRDAIAEFRENFPEVPVTTRLARGVPDIYLTKLSKTMGLVVVGTHPLEIAVDSLWREVSLMMVEHAACDVAVIPDPPTVDESTDTAA